jgi:hypothetical protein
MEQNWGSRGVVPSVSFELGTDDALDVLKEDEVRLAFGDASEDVGEKVAGVFVSAALARRAKGLAWEAAREDVHESTKAAPWEGPKIRPDRC